MTPVYPNNLEELTESLMWPLNLFYAYYRRDMPEITPLFDWHMPEPFKQLLVHDRNMTPTLEAYYKSTIHIERLNVVPDRDECSREVILRLDLDKMPVEYGSSRIFLNTLSQEAVDLVCEGHVPLGTILNQCNCTHTVVLSGFFKVKPTSFFNHVFSSLNGSSLYGRRNTLVALDGTPIAEVCEILPPSDETSVSEHPDDN
jgi:chorismate-pyruvate lyase